MVEVRLKEVPFRVKRFKLVTTTNDIGWFITNYLAAYLNREMVIDTMKVHWQTEAFHRSSKQLTGAEKYQYQKAGSQHNYFRTECLSWLSLRQYARHIEQSMYQTHQQRWEPYLRNHSKNRLSMHLHN